MAALITLATIFSALVSVSSCIIIDDVTHF